MIDYRGSLPSVALRCRGSGPLTRESQKRLSTRWRNFLSGDCHPCPDALAALQPVPRPTHSKRSVNLLSSLSRPSVYRTWTSIKVAHRRTRLASGGVFDLSASLASDSLGDFAMLYDAAINTIRGAVSAYSDANQPAIPIHSSR